MAVPRLAAAAGRSGRGGSRLAALAALVVLVPVAALLAACGSGASDGKVTLRFVWWGNQQRADVTEKAIALFEERNPNIQVDTSFSDYQAFFDKLATETAGGNAPDVMQMDYRYLNEYAGRGVLLDLGPFVGKQLRLDEWNQGFANTGRSNDKLAALPLGQNTTVMAYDPAVFQAAGLPVPTADQPLTWEQYRDAAQRIHDANGQVHGVTDFGMNEDAFEIWLRQRGKALYTADGELGFAKSDLAEYWRLSQRFRDTGAATPAELNTLVVSTGPEQSPLGRKQSAAEFTFDSTYPAFVQAHGGELAIAPYPADSADNIGMYRKPAVMVSVSARSKHHEESVKLIDFLLNDPDAGKALGATRGLPPNLKIRERISAGLTGVDKQIFDFEAAIDSKLGDAPPAPPKGDGAVHKLFDRKYQEVAFGRLSVDDGVNQFFDEAEQTLG
ncbi:ABC transporter substrate-binding protein [Goodfellowiella coeruleoviolacea]|uniref:Multiple sugar transport system substrate-binding protein n=1 Tax=Goodfellowiella coeruleoviolacea TaxID=334858 RepID=A0AAE3GJH5_9PSEU|nr:extracellular solute-binding protein [Goodfellowiella coeruleoviolacea]MCP2169381.1 multiple sugar transport system substrate-binding protein [Goodfellowiella coeruleoviolacea]